MKQIDEQGYKDGGAAFAKGKTLRSLIEARIADDQPAKSNEPDKDYRQIEAYRLSFELGFADGLLAKLRSR